MRDSHPNALSVARGALGKGAVLTVTGVATEGTNADAVRSKDGFGLGAASASTVGGEHPAES